VLCVTVYLKSDYLLYLSRSQSLCLWNQPQLFEHFHWSFSIKHSTYTSTPTHFLTQVNFYRRESFDLSISLCSFPVIPSSDLFFFTSMKSSEQTLHCSSLSSTSVICVTTSSFWALAFSFSSCGRKSNYCTKNFIFTYFLDIMKSITKLPQNLVTGHSF